MCFFLLKSSKKNFNLNVLFAIMVETKFSITIKISNLAQGVDIFYIDLELFSLSKELNQSTEALYSLFT